MQSRIESFKDIMVLLGDTGYGSVGNKFLNGCMKNIVAIDVTSHRIYDTNNQIYLAKVTLNGRHVLKNIYGLSESMSCILSGSADPLYKRINLFNAAVGHGKNVEEICVQLFSLRPDYADRQLSSPIGLRTDGPLMYVLLRCYLDDAWHDGRDFRLPIDLGLEHNDGVEDLRERLSKVAVSLKEHTADAADEEKDPSGWLENKAEYEYLDEDLEAKLSGEFELQSIPNEVAYTPLPNEDFDGDLKFEETTHAGEHMTLLLSSPPRTSSS